MNDSHRSGWFNDNQKFWAFIVLVASVVILAVYSSSIRGDAGNAAEIMLINARLRLVDGTVVGLIGIAGMAAQALFRTSETEKKNAEALQELAKKTPPVAVPPDQTTPPSTLPPGPRFEELFPEPPAGVGRIGPIQPEQDDLPPGASMDEPSWQTAER